MLCKSTSTVIAGRTEKNDGAGLGITVRQSWQSVLASVKLRPESIRANGPAALLDQAVSGQTGQRLRGLVGHAEITKAVNQYHQRAIEALEGWLELVRL